ncbi:MAG TPA: hypothetical protein VNS32_01735 [Flavisolibacter sp.]|nr:hypothetical protein [Flavisolibacter sp.]
MSLPSNAQKEIEEHLKKVEEIRRTAFKKELISTAQNNRITDEQLYAVAKAFTNNHERAMRVENLKKAREARGIEETPSIQK